MPYEVALAKARQKYPGAFEPTPPDCQVQKDALANSKDSGNFILLPNGSCYQYPATKDSAWALAQARQERPELWQMTTAVTGKSIDVGEAWVDAVLQVSAGAVIGIAVFAVMSRGVWQRASRNSAARIGRWWAACTAGFVTFSVASKFWHQSVEELVFRVLVVAAPMAIAGFALGWLYGKWKLDAQRNASSPTAPSRSSTVAASTTRTTTVEPSHARTVDLVGTNSGSTNVATMHPPTSDADQHDDMSATQLNPGDVDEDALWAKAMTELESNDRQSGLWAKSYAEADGDDRRARASYLRARFDALKVAELERMSAAQQAATGEEAARVREKRECDAVPTQHWNTVREAVRGEPTAQMHLGQIFRQGLGVKADVHKAVEWYTKAAENGLRDAQYNVALLLWENAEDFESVKDPRRQALKWMQIAAQRGDRDAADKLRSFRLRAGRQVSDEADQLAGKWLRQRGMQP